AFAIPVSIARNVLEQIIKDGEVTRGWLGIEPADQAADFARASSSRESGVVIRGIVRGGPADRAGIHVQDIVIEIDGKPTRETTPKRTSTMTTTGVSNVMPKAMNIVSTNERYLSMSVIIVTPAGA